MSTTHKQASRSALQQLMETLISELGVEAIFPTGDSVPVLFQQHRDKYTLSQHELMGTTGNVIIRADALHDILVTLEIGLVLVIDGQPFRVMAEPHLDTFNDCWSLFVMAQPTEEDTVQ